MSDMSEYVDIGSLLRRELRARARGLRVPLGSCRALGLTGKLYTRRFSMLFREPYGLSNCCGTVTKPAFSCVLHAVFQPCSTKVSRFNREKQADSSQHRGCYPHPRTLRTQRTLRTLRTLPAPSYPPHTLRAPSATAPLCALLLLRTLPPHTLHTLRQHPPHPPEPPHTPHPCLPTRCRTVLAALDAALVANAPLRNMKMF